MTCIWSTSIRLTWGVVSLRAIIKNMHMWSSRLLKPKLQAAILQASKCLPKDNLSGSHDPPSWCLPRPAMDCPKAVSTNRSPIENPVVAQMFGKAITPEKHNSPILHPRIDTPTPSKNTDHTSSLRNRRPEAALGTRKDSFFGNNKSATAGPNTARPNGLFGQNAPDVFGPGFGCSLSTTGSVGLRSQSATKSCSNLFGGTSTSVARESGQNTSEPDAGCDYVKGGLFGSSKPAIGHSATKGTHEERGPSTSLAQPDSDGRPVSSTNEVSTWESSRKPVAISPSKSEPKSPSKPGSDLSSTPGSGSPSKPALIPSPKSDSARLGISKKSDRGGPSSDSSPSNISAPMDTHRTSSVPAAKQTDVCDITTALASTSLGSTSTHHPTLNAATDPGHRHLDKAPTNPEKDSNRAETPDTWQRSSFFREFVSARTNKHGLRQCVPKGDKQEGKAQRYISISLMMRMIRDLGEEHQLDLLKRVDASRMIDDGTLFVPLYLVVRWYNLRAKPAEQIPSRVCARCIYA